MGERTELLACVDETGNFDCPSEVLGVGGPVLAVDSKTEGALEAMLRRALPYIPFPPHAAHLNLRSYHALSWRRLRPAKQEKLRGAFPNLAAVEKVLLARSDLPDILKHPLALPEIHDLKDCDQWFRRNEPDSYSLLGEVLEEVQQRGLYFLKDVARHMNGKLVAVVKLPGSALATRSDASADQYLVMLEFYLEHLLLLYEAPGASTHITLRLSGRKVHLGPNGVLVELTREHVEALLAKVRAKGVGDGVEVECRAPEPFDAYMPAGLAVADMAMNRLRFIVPRAETWNEFRQLAKGHIGLPVEVRVPGMGGLPTIAFAGPSEVQGLARESQDRWSAALIARRTVEEA
ncbi:hypothetical protein D7V97_11840 [Corallococcus sp. CA053C]|uniref:hypothetical protein n=1 Tax=Corallococcus sp. CA053C TaxID=2316732 RepID=UPI000EA301A1|nr:hypothetical protein [Corallococcus sp. CA053C]RKH11169.1 hypothetical protein D7V97_11840 [Corallococcus sp. CA053C]